jgi:hypothetical protein
MPSVAALYSGGTDSTLAARLLDPFFDVTLCSCTFGLEPVADHVRPGADALGLSLETVALDESVARDAVERMVADGYPRRGIQQVHEHALEVVAATDVDAVADGTRRDDRVPTIERPAAQSLEDRHGVDYLQPLAGYGRSAIDALAAREFVVERGPSEEVATGDYETELRSIMRAEYGSATVDEVFPDHVQSRVAGRQE